MGGAREFEGGEGPFERVRRPGAGRTKALDVDPELLAALDSLVEAESRGDPMLPLRWTLKSIRRLAVELTKMGHQASPFLVGKLLHYMDYSPAGDVQAQRGRPARGPRRSVPLLTARAKFHLAAGQPVVSVDCKKSTWSERPRAMHEMLAAPAGCGRRLLIGA